MHSCVLLALLALAAVQLVVPAARASSDVLLPALPGKPLDVDVSLVLFQGAQVPADRYLPFIRVLQAACDFRLWVAVPAFVGSVPAPPELDSAVRRVEGALQAAGMPTAAHRFFMGHSLGGAMLQDWLAGHPEGVAGQVLAGAMLLRKHNTTYPVPTLAMAGELDGLMRVTRTAEGFWRFVMGAPDAAVAARDFPVVILPGANHMQWASGAPPPLVRARDLRAEVDDDAAHAQMAGLVAAFMAGQAHRAQAAAGGAARDSLARAAASGADRLDAALRWTRDFVAPIVTAFVDLEANVHWRPWCDSDHPAPHCPFYPAWPLQKAPRTPSPDTACTCGVGFTATAMAHMAGVAEQPLLSLHTVDAIHDVTDTRPFHHPHLWANCSDALASGRACTLNLTTVTQPVYDTLDDWDTGFTHASAAELRTKMVSRQIVFKNSVDAAADVATTDEATSTCAEVNALSYALAQRLASDTARARFAKSGQPMCMAPDRAPIVPAGPAWIYSGLKFRDVAGDDGATVLEVTSTKFITSDAWPKWTDAGGYHYCKVLSPARALEWIYVDGLRLHAGIGS
eukprot:CAMPEP_0177657640 /NCGR_PEP_ID=MMETSP0447-20121125/16314_1 /TAXON_ID=0 /ORGANISM="Stygamoeba regulata, Strain BSH-02190019" /LENGTH=567 /DNA_ID=CAMNT_0019162051 /DNA_START=139 /DNA_END=1842 /DNA_ORIENTATION=+